MDPGGNHVSDIERQRIEGGAQPRRPDLLTERLQLRLSADLRNRLAAYMRRTKRHNENATIREAVEKLIAESG